MTRETLAAELTKLLQNNQRETNGYHYTLPSPELYPFQWLWDSCFHAVMYNALGNHEAAKAELTSACTLPLESGLLPHIIYWERPQNGEQWGREERSDALDAAWGVQDCSAITQPPLIARVVLETFEATGDTDWARTLLPTLIEYFEGLAVNRVFEDTGLLMLINPDESGEDNSPRFDELLNLPPQHSKHDHLDKRIELLHRYVECDFREIGCMDDIFAVVDVAFNAIYLDGLRAIKTLTEHINGSVATKTFTNRLEHVEAHFHAFFAPMGWNSYDVVHKKPIEVATWNRFMPLYTGAVSKTEAADLVAKLNDTDTFAGTYGLRTTAANEPSYDPEDGFWRGPVWASPHWFIARGLRQYGYDTEADALRDQLVTLIETSGWREQYHPDTGTGQGASNFTWSGLALDLYN